MIGADSGLAGVRLAVLLRGGDGPWCVSRDAEVGWSHPMSVAECLAGLPAGADAVTLLSRVSVLGWLEGTMGLSRGDTGPCHPAESGKSTSV